MRGEAWFYVGDNDVFAETFLNFLAFSDEQRSAFLRAHADLLTADFWRHVQERVRAGELMFQPFKSSTVKNSELIMKRHGVDDR